MGSLHGLSANFSSYEGGSAYKDILVLDTSKEKQIEYTDKWGYWEISDHKERGKVTEYLKKVNFKYSDLGEEGYGKIIRDCEKVPLWVLSDVVNRGSEVKPLANGGYCIIGNTIDFANYLIEKKIGYVMASPIIQNPNHRFSSDYSLNRAWLWVPPKHLPRTLNVGRTFGESALPSKQEWLERIGKDLSLKATKVVDKVFATRTFPEEIRFSKKRDALGRFAKEA